MCRHIQPKKNKQIQNWIRARGPPALRCARRRPVPRAAGLNPILDFWDFFRLYMAAPKRGGAGSIGLYSFYGFLF